jgi:4-hydroxy-tetrahydrodipicolinate reductase
LAPGGTMLRVAVVGASGRMGRAVVRLAVERGHTVACAVANSDIGRDAGELIGVARLGVVVTDDLSVVAASGAGVVIDFSAPAATCALVDVAATAGIAVVSGTTGMDTSALRAIERASKQVPVLWEPNMSAGVFVLGELLRQAVASLGPGYDVEIVETHHRRKVDAPSGTALRLAEIAKDARTDGSASRRDVSGEALRHGRSGRPGERPAGEIGMHAVRGGDVVGDHVVHLLGPGERLELVHRASSRDLFAHGALRAAGWIVGKPPGRYSLRDVLG